MKGDKYLLIAVSIKKFCIKILYQNLVSKKLVIFSCIFENVVKILACLKFDISFFLKVLLSSGKTNAILASSRKSSFDELLFIAVENRWNRTLSAIWKSLGGIMTKPTVSKKRLCYAPKKSICDSIIFRNIS